MRRWICFLVFPFVFLVVAHPVDAMVRAGVEVDSDAGGDDDVDVQIIVWDGPGFYYGIWFGNERDYNNWYYHHHHYDHDDHDHHDHHDDHDDHDHNNGGNGHHGSGGHHRGGGGGGHRNGNGGGHH